MKVKETERRLRKRGFVYLGPSHIYTINGRYLEDVKAYPRRWMGEEQLFSITIHAHPSSDAKGPRKQLWDANRRLVEYIEANFEEVK